MKEVLRWIGVLPAAILGMMVFYLLGLLFGGIGYNTFIYSTNPDAGFSIIKFVIKLAANGLAGAGFVMAGSYTAPKYQFHTSVVLAILLTFFLGISGCLAFQLNHPWYDILDYAATLVAAWVGVKYVQENL